MIAHLGLGSNLGSWAGDPHATLLAATSAIAGLEGVRAVRRSQVYRSEPLGPPQPAYANAAIELDTSLGADELFAATSAMEARFGRRREVPLGPRTLDIDLLFFAGEVRPVGPLVLPHPRLHERRFVLLPLAELAPDLRHPRLGKSVAELLDACPDRSRVEPWEGATVSAVAAHPGDARGEGA